MLKGIVLNLSGEKLKDVCRTRWIERIDGMDVFEQLFAAIVFTFEDMNLNLEDKFNRETSAKATSFLKLVTSFDFIVSLVVTRSVFDTTHSVTQLLQARANDIFYGLQLIQALKDLIRSIRMTINVYHNKWYAVALRLAELVNVCESKPRTCGRQIHRGNTPAENVSEYFKRILTIPLVDHLNRELSERFDQTNLTAYFGLSVILVKMVSLINHPTKKTWKEKFRSFAEFYSDDLPSHMSLDAELDLWEKYWEKL